MYHSQSITLNDLSIPYRKIQTKLYCPTFASCVTYTHTDNCKVFQDEKGRLKSRTIKDIIFNVYLLIKKSANALQNHFLFLSTTNFLPVTQINFRFIFYDTFNLKKKKKVNQLITSRGLFTFPINRILQNKLLIL